jgi:uncharacterized small protein (DUF1192 family)
VADSYWAELYQPVPLPQEEIDRIRAENDAIAAALDAAGIAYTRNGDETGIEWLEYDYEDQAALDAVNRVYAELYPPQPLPQEEIDRIRAENDGLAAAFDAAGIAYTRVGDETGFEWLEWDYDDAAAQQVATDYYAVLYPPIDCPGVEPCLVAADDAASDQVVVEEAALRDDVAVEPGLIDPICGGGEPYVPTAEELAANLAETDGLAAAFDAAGVAYTRTTDEINGFQYLEFDYEDPIAQQVSTDFYNQRYGPTAEETAAREAGIAAMVAAFDGAGVTYELQGEAPYQYLTFDLANPASLDAIRAVLAAR